MTAIALNLRSRAETTKFNKHLLGVEAQMCLTIGTCNFLWNAPLKDWEVIPKVKDTELSQILEATNAEPPLLQFVAGEGWHHIYCISKSITWYLTHSTRHRIRTHRIQKPISLRRFTSPKCFLSDSADRWVSQALWRHCWPPSDSSTNRNSAVAGSSQADNASTTMQPFSKL